MGWKDFTDTPGTPTSRGRTCWDCAHANRPSGIAPGGEFVKRHGFYLTPAGELEEHTVDLCLACARCKSPPPQPEEEANMAKNREGAAEPQNDASENPTSGSSQEPPPAETMPVEASDAPSPSAAMIAEHEHYLEIRRLNRDVSGVYFEWVASKEKTAELKKTLDARLSELRQLISNGANPQLPLFDGGDDEPAAAERPEAWRIRGLDVLGLSDSLVALLADGGLGTLGELQDFWKSGKYLTDLRGVGGEKSATITDAFADYASQHPEVYGLATDEVDEQIARAADAKRQAEKPADEKPAE